MLVTRSLERLALSQMKSETTWSAAVQPVAERLLLQRRPLANDSVFLPAQRYASVVFATATCPSVCPSVCLSVRLSHAGIAPSRAKAGSWNVHHLIAPWLYFLARYESSKNSQGVTPKERAKWGWGRLFSAIFDQYVVISWKRCILDTKLLQDGNRKPYASYRMVSLSMTFSDPWPGFQGHGSFKRRTSPKRRILQTQLLYRTLIGYHRQAIDRQTSYTAYNPTALT